ncbi:MAG: ankyrin repeat domain-containing protein [Ardenticatenaceae bacterium]|nr:ankyrin repeat domain-containing protein [Ardenticatenaceae bacterium]
MSISSLVNTVTQLAAATHTFTETDLNNEAWAWEAYEGHRYALLQTYLELRELAVNLSQERAQSERPITAAQRILAQHRAAYRDFQSLFIGLTDADLDTVPKPHEWPIRTILIHVYYVERNFLATILNGQWNRQGTKAPPPLPTREAAKDLLHDEADLPLPTHTLAEIWASYHKLHQRVMHELGPLSDEELTYTSYMWEPKAYTNSFRMHRFHTHLREHTNQLAKTLVWLDKAPNEAKLLLRQIFEALAQVEGALIGAEAWGTAECSALAEQIAERTAEITTAVTQSRQMMQAVKSGDETAVKQLLAANPALVNTTGEDGLFAVVTAAYHQQQGIVQALVEAGAVLETFETAVIGDLDKLKANLADYPEELNAYSRDGYTPLQLACFFGHEEMVNYLLAAGGDIHAVSQNAMRIQPLHAAAANGNLAILRALLEKGADVHAPQAEGYTALAQAQQSQNKAMIALLQQFGAN